MRPIYQPHVATPHPSFPSVLDASGLEQVRDGFTCNGWRVSLSDRRGLGVDGAGRFTQSGCGSTIPVACCAPVR